MPIFDPTIFDSSIFYAEDIEGTITTTGLEQTLFTEENAGIFYVRLDLNTMNPTSIIEIREYISARAASAQRLIDSPLTYQVGLQPSIVELAHRIIPANCSYAVTIKRVAGPDFTVVWSKTEVG